MISFSELRDQSLAFYAKLASEREQLADGTYAVMSNERLKEIHETEFPDYPVEISSNFVVSGPLFGTGYSNWEYSKTHAVEGLEFFKQEGVRLKLTIWYATVRAFSHDTEVHLRNGVDSNSQVIYGRLGSDSGEREESNAMFVLRKIANIRPSEEEIQAGVNQFRVLNDTLNYNTRLVQEETGLNKLLEEGPSGDRDWKILMESQIVDLQKQLPSNALVSRTWGFEVESPDCKGVEPLLNSGIEKGDDGSLRSYESNDECDCDCRECTYHSCDCDNCSDYNEDPDHCGDDSCSTAESAEYRTIGGVQRSRHNGLYHLCERLNAEDAEMNDTAGTHIHVYGQDLTTNQVGQVLAIYKRLENLFDVICGRENTGYARRIVVEHVRVALRKSYPVLELDKPRAVNVSQLINGRGTIEFRQMDCNYNADRITLFAWMVRGIVTAAQRGATIAAFASVQSYFDLVVALGKYNYFLANENPGLIIPGTKVDAENIKKVAHSRA